MDHILPILPRPRQSKLPDPLIGSDFYQGKQLDLFDEEEQMRINAFDWEIEFEDIMQTGGFDAVIGNPPWGAAFYDADLEYLKRKHSRVVWRMVDSYIYFIDRSLLLLNPSGNLGFIIPSTILNQTDAKPVREILLDRGLSSLLSLGQGIFGPKVLNTSTILVSNGSAESNDFVVGDITRVSVLEKSSEMTQAPRATFSQWKKMVLQDTQRVFFTMDVSSTILLQRLQGNHKCLRDAVNGTIQRGVSPDIAAAHLVTSSQYEELKSDADLLWPSISGDRIKRYQRAESNQWLIYTSRDTDIDAYPSVKAYLQLYKEQNTCKEVRNGKHPWWSLHRPRNPSIFDSPKIIGITTSKRIELLFDEKDSLCVTDGMYILKPSDEVNPYFLLAVMQSRAFLFLYRIANQGESRVIPQVKASKLYDLPFPIVADEMVVKKVETLARNLYHFNDSLSNANTSHQKTLLQRQIESTDREIDRLVYQLYGLTDEEIAIVEEATK